MRNKNAIVSTDFVLCVVWDANAKCLGSTSVVLTTAYIVFIVVVSLWFVTMSDSFSSSVHLLKAFLTMKVLLIAYEAIV